MKKVTRLSVAGLLVLSVLLFTVGSVFAKSTTSTTDLWTDPTATANQKDVTFTSTVLEPTLLPGTINDDAGLILPVGFTVGAEQFGGNGIKISGLSKTADTVKVCFSFPVYQYSWSGTIYQWSGSAWVAQPTTIVAPTGENSLYYACSAKVSNGTYALIMGYSE
jgi:hypothetical protein